jgi:hypothetical protein
MTTTEIRFVPPAECVAWCSDGDGHPSELCAEDQHCDSGGHYLYLPLNYRKRPDEFAQIGVGAERRIGFAPCVYVHLTLMEPDVDAAAKLTATEARWLAAELLKTAELIEDSGNRYPVGSGSP